MRPAPPQIRAFLDEPYSLDSSKVDAYRQNGFVKLEGIITGEPLGYYRELIGLAVGHRFKDDQRALSAEAGLRAEFLASLQSLAALSGNR